MKEYWDSLSKVQQAELAQRVGYSQGYLRLIFNGYKKAGFVLAQRLEEQTEGVVSRADLRPDIYPSQENNSPAP